LEFGVFLFFVERGTLKYPVKTPNARQGPTPHLTYGSRQGQATLGGGKHSHHYIIHAPQGIRPLE